MLTKNKINLIFLIIIAISFSNCVNPLVYPPEPKIDIIQVTIKDTVDGLDNKVKIYSIYFKIFDGDGDFGIKDEDTLIQHYNDSLYANNFFATLYHLKNGVPTQYDIELPLVGAVPYTPPVGLNVYFKALIIYDLQIYSLPDTLKLKFHIIDRHLNESNEQETPWITPDYYGTLLDTVTVISN